MGGGVVAPAGSVWARRRYDPYGETRYTYGRSPTDFGFTGQREDGGTGLMYYRARYYHPALGRFVSADAMVPSPQNPVDFNRYAYVRNSPLNYIDPSGHTEAHVARQQRQRERFQDRTLGQWEQRLDPGGDGGGEQAQLYQRGAGVQQDLLLPGASLQHSGPLGL